MDTLISPYRPSANALVCLGLAAYSYFIMLSFDFSGMQLNICWFYVNVTVLLPKFCRSIFTDSVLVPVDCTDLCFKQTSVLNFNKRKKSYENTAIIQVSELL